MCRAGCPTRPPCLPAAGRRVGVLNLPQGVALVTTRSGKTPPASKFVLGFPGFPHHGNSFGLATFSSALALVDFKNSSRASLTLRHGSGWPTLCDFVLCLPAAGRQRAGNSLLRGQPNHRPTIGL